MEASHLAQLPNVFIAIIETAPRTEKARMAGAVNHDVAKRRH